MFEQIESAFRSIVSAMQIAQLYTTAHPRFSKFLDKAYDELQAILKSQSELVFGIVNGELAYGKEIFFDLSKNLSLAIMRLQQKGVERISFYRGLEKKELAKFIEYLAAPKDEIKKEIEEFLIFSGVKNISAGRIKSDGASNKSASEDKDSRSNLYEASSQNVSRTLQDVLSDEGVDYLNLRFTLSTVMENLITNFEEFIKLTTIKRYNLGTFTHSLNVSILSMFFSSKLHFVKDDVLEIGIAALFHDLGKLHISNKIINKPGRLTDEEFAKMQSHTIIGAEVLLKHVNTLGILPVVVSYEHHLRFGSSGYPKLTFFKEPHVASMIVAICDVYDALYQKRNYKNNFSPDLIYDIMLKEREKVFDPKLLDKFFSMMGVWPVGAIVSLSDKRIAVVREQNEDDIWSPKVEVISPAEAKEKIDLKEKKGQLKIEFALNPWVEGKEYLALI
ncbi:MAG: HD domain-containing protein [Candidatus Omnitrophica bacterium]|nr:HD domain-containing protein [Candidatus Omnitrophota bacterium]